MRKATWLTLTMLCMGAGLWACGEAFPEGSSEGTGSASSPQTSAETSAVAPMADDDSDPMAHIRYLSSKELNGRYSTSTGIDKASKYIIERATKYGLSGPNPNDANGAYSQTLSSGFSPDPDFVNALRAEGVGARSHRFGPELSALSSSAADLAAPAAATPKRNILARLDGTGAKKDELLVVTAHLDAVQCSGSAYCPGADDDGSGSGTLLSMIPALAQAQKDGKLNRSILFLWTTAEEQGLVGSKYFVDHPIKGLELSKIVGVISMDMLARFEDGRMSIIDKKSDGSVTYLSGLLTQANKALAKPFSRINHDINEDISRQDGYSFSKKGEDVLVLYEGLSNPNGGGSENPDYHSSRDNVDGILKDNNGTKPGHFRDLVIEILKLAVNR